MRVLPSTSSTAWGRGARGRRAAGAEADGDWAVVVCMPSTLRYFHIT